ncbi:DUF1648 domain-containing protein [Chryseobacterium gregarium]|uniref:DUF1648 domain-containing protein n=1 Tax=Chryseobacterium gregarium TaxID=456299 RepID=UPI00040864D0|nr:DUF1648 domain-containing protein [Chryseobacterium gregarium]
MKDIFLVIFDVFNFGLLVFLWRFTIKHYAALPQTIPVHFDFDGKPDRFGSKKYSFLMPVVAGLVYILFAYVVRDPDSSNYPVKITKDNREAQFLIMETFIRWLCALIILLSLNSQDYIFRYAVNERAKPKISMAVTFLTVIGSLGVLFVFVGLFK